MARLAIGIIALFELIILMGSYDGSLAALNFIISTGNMIVRDV